MASNSHVDHDYIVFHGRRHRTLDQHIQHTLHADPIADEIAPLSAGQIGIWLGLCAMQTRSAAPTDHRQPADCGGIGGDCRPMFQVQGVAPSARRRHTTASCRANIPGMRSSAGRGAALNAM